MSSQDNGEVASPSHSEDVTYDERNSMPLNRVFGIETSNVPFYRKSNAQEDDKVVDSSIAKQLMQSILGPDATRNKENMTRTKLTTGSNSLEQSVFERNYLLHDEESGSRLKERSMMMQQMANSGLANDYDESITEMQVMHRKSRQAPLEPAIIDKATVGFTNEELTNAN